VVSGASSSFLKTVAAGRRRTKELVAAGFGVLVQVVVVIGVVQRAVGLPSIRVKD